jgi:large subunit ribosomal protein L24|uniref:Large ribosomal subunit protein uL24 n=1 Tax=Leptospirillum ferriphilum TaxID=178606 RepID=A0A7C3R3F6_9BACT
MKIKNSSQRKQSFPALRKDDKVKILSGKDKGKEGLILKVDRSANRVIVENVNQIIKAIKPDQNHPQGGFLTRENYLGASRVMLICPSCHKPTRIAQSILSDGKKVRVCKHCQEHIDK